MKEIFIIFVIMATYTIPQGVAEETSIYGMQSIKVLCETESKYEFVSKYMDLPGFDFLSLTRKLCEPAEILVDSKVLNSFKQNLTNNGIKYKVFIEDMSAFLNQTQTKRTKRYTNDNFFHKYPRYDEIKNFLKELENNNKEIVKYFTIGTSFEGRELMSVKISQPDGKKKRAVVIDAGIHAREWIAPTTALHIINEIVEKRDDHKLLKMYDFYIIPLLNSDGYEYSHQSFQTRLWRKTRSTRPDTKCIGVDANRNFDIAWPTGGTTVDPCSATYPGPHPFSEPETKALRDFLLSKDIKLYVTFHSFGNYILYPWSYTKKKHPKFQIFNCMANKAEKAVRKVHGTKYTIGTVYDLLYETRGCSHDWAIKSAKVESAFLIELPSKVTKFAPPNTQIISIGQEMFEAVKAFAQFSNADTCPIL